MRVFALLAFLGLGLGYFWTSVRALPQESSVKKAELPAEQLNRAKALFRAKCARCHGADGRGQTVIGKMLEVPDFTNGTWWSDHGKIDDLIESITKGNGDMPPFGKKLTKPEISLLANYLRRFNKSEP